jgi:voltage-gated potassium channel
VGIGREGIPLQALRRSARQLWVLLALLFLVMAGAVFFYLFTEAEQSGIEWTVVDCMYMAVLTITTIGFAEVHPLSQLGQLFTTGFALLGVGLVALAIRSAASLIVGQQLSVEVQRRRRVRALNGMNDHYIVCGYGRMGQETVHQLRGRGLHVVVIEQDSEAIADLEEEDIPFVRGNATLDEHLNEAGVDRAKCLVAAVATDEDNLFIVMSARVLNPNLYIVARASRDETVNKLQRAGANSVHSPYVGGGRDLAYAAVEPGVVHFLEQVLHQSAFDVDFRSVSVPRESPVAGKPMLGSGVMQENGAMILAVLSADNELRTNPRPTTTVGEGDTIIAMGTREQISRLDRAVNGTD